MRVLEGLHRQMLHDFHAPLSHLLDHHLNLRRDLELGRGVLGGHHLWLTQVKNVRQTLRGLEGERTVGVGMAFFELAAIVIVNTSRLLRAR